jgi:hypothetical protein
MFCLMLLFDCTVVAVKSGDEKGEGEGTKDKPTKASDENENCTFASDAQLSFVYFTTRSDFYSQEVNCGLLNEVGMSRGGKLLLFEL